VRVAFAGERRALAVPVVRRVVGRVLAAEGTPDAAVTVTFLSTARMRSLNRRALGRDRATDVLAFGMAHDDRLVGDIYVCPALARRSARQLGIPAREELTRLVVHGTLHVLGHDHPAATGRERSPMWRRQERYVAELVASPSAKE
jgi:probable rRNA maturation factor